MNGRQGQLLLLIRLLDDQLPSDAAQRARDLLRDPDVLQRWNVLREVAESPLDPAAAPRPDAERHVSAEKIAALVDGALTPEETLRVEDACWQSRRLLGEVVSAVRFAERHAAGMHAAVTRDPTFTSRMLEAFDRQFAPAPATSTPVASPADAMPLDPDRRNARPPANPGLPQGEFSALAGLPARPDIVRRGRSGSARLRRALPRLAATAATIATALVLALVVALLVSIGHAPRSTPGTTFETVDASFPRPATSPTSDSIQADTRHADTRQAEAIPAAAGTSDRGRPDTATGRPPDAPPGLSRRAPSNHVASDEPAFDRALVAERPATGERSAPAPASSERPQRGPQEVAPTLVNPPRSQSFAVQWESIEGLLVGREDAAATWRGALSEPPLPGDAEFAVLPGSWARAHTTLGTMTLAEDTQVSWNARESSLLVSLVRGRVAFARFPTDQALCLAVANDEWTIQATDPESEFGVIVDGTAISLFVRRGEVSVADTKVERRRQVELAATGVGVPTAFRDAANWSDRPEQTVRIAAGVQAELLASRNVFQELAALQETAGALQTPARLWNLALFPDRALDTLLLADDPESRRDAFQWLVAQHEDDPRTRQVWMMLARGSGDPALVRLMMQWQVALRERRPLQTEFPAATAAQMVRALNHRDPTLRQLAAMFLESGFGHARSHPIPFTPRAPDAVRREAIRQWLQVLRAAYARSR